jgi:PBSX family phage portal protein
MSGDDKTIKVLGSDGLEDPTESDLEKISASKEEKAESTQQEGTPEVSADEYFDPPKDPEQLLGLLEKSETHQACVEAKSKAVAGHGFDLVPHDSVDENSVSDVSETLRQFWHEGTFQLGPGAIHATASEVLENAWNDLEAVGWLTVEILCNPNTGEPTGLAHIPSYQIRKRYNAPGYVELDDAGRIDQYYGSAGNRYGDDQTFVDADSGEFGSSSGDVDTVANELIVIRNYSALSPYYGLPDVVPGIKTLAGDLAAREYNRRFFSNDTVPRFAVIVEGGELTERAWNDLEETFQQLRDQEKAHSGVLLETTDLVTGALGEEQGANIRLEPLTVGVDEDAGFVTYRDNNEHYLLQAHSVPPVAIGRTEGVNFANAKSQRVNFAQETVKPKQERFSARLHQILHVTAFEEPDWTIEFDLHGGENRLRNSKIAANRMKAASGTLTVNEARGELGHEPLDGAEGEVLVATLKKAMNPTGSSQIEESPQQDQGNENGPPGQQDQRLRSGVERARSDDVPSRRELLNKASAQFKEGDVVDYGDGNRGVIVGVKTSDFEAPTEEGETIEVDDGGTIYVVARASGGFGYFEPRELSRSEFSESGDPSELKESMQKAQFELPDGWTRATLLDAWSSMGGSFTGCMDTLDDEEMCASMKDTVLGTTYWR